jgi:hypothetical protein
MLVLPVLESPSRITLKVRLPMVEEVIDIIITATLLFAKFGKVYEYFTGGSACRQLVKQYQPHFFPFALDRLISDILAR